MYQVKVIGNRPDFRVFIELLYGFGRNVDTDGNSEPVSSRIWTDLYINDRESDTPSVEISASRDNIDIFEIKSKSAELETLAALYLFLYCGSFISFNGTELNQGELARLRTRYSVQLERVKKSIWHQSSDDNLYPNLS